MKLIIMNPQSQQTFDVEWVEFNTPSGNIIVQEHHAPTILTLSPGQETRYKNSDGTIATMIVQAGIAHVTQDAVTLILHA